MKDRDGEALSAWRNILTGAVALTVLLVVGALTAPRARAQGPATQSPTVPQWETVAGGKMAFDVASVKLNRSGDPALHADILLPLPPAQTTATGNRFTAINAPLRLFITFAYKLTFGQMGMLVVGLPRSIESERFDIDARAAEGSPTKDQFRLMVQSLLADRFKLTSHFETRQFPVFALVLAKTGKFGPQLKPHSDDATCSTGSPPATARGATTTPECGVIRAFVASGRMQSRARKVSMGYVADNMYMLGRVDRLVLDRTGLKGNFDLTMDAPDIPPPPGAAIERDPSAPTFLEVLQDQLGLKLESQIGPVDVLIIDHVELPSEN